MTDNPYQPLLITTRGDTIESVHYGALAVVDPAGNLVASVGDPCAVTFLRSSAKPFQALPFIEAGGHTHYNLTQKEIALICASHSGTDQHLAVASQIQRRAGILEKDLLCGVHPPMHKPTAERMLKAGEPLTPNRHNCSGKHSGMLAYARMNDEPLEGYLELDHPVQRRILRTMSEMCGLSEEEICLGTDGCSAPNFAIPLYNAALGWARLADPSGLPDRRVLACCTILDAMTAYPEMVAGPDRLDTTLMQVAKDKLTAKAGAEGYQGVAIRPDMTGPGSPALGIAIKISDGDGFKRARAAVTLETLRQLGILSPTELVTLKEYGPVRKIKNWRKLDVGELRPVFQLQVKNTARNVKYSRIN
jgi:L-asparaginase II